MAADVVERMLAFAAEAPGHPAVAGDGAVVSYGEFARKARRIAAAIAAAGDSPRVLIRLPQGADAYAAMFATLMAGGYYAAVNVSAPAQVQEKVMQRFAPDVVVTAAGQAHTGGDVVRVDMDALGVAELADAREAHDLAYVMFTSGSTGEPKGVMIGREGLGHYAAWATEAMAVTPEDRWSQHPNIAFDLSVLDIYGALCSGATLVPLVQRRDRLVPAEAIRRHGLSIWDSVPSVVDLMQRAGHVTAAHLDSLRLMTFCGEPLLDTHLHAIFAARPDLVVHNTYGPTEATVSCTLIRLGADTYRDACDRSVALGDAIADMELRLVGGDDDDEGEILISGPQVARGYWRDPEATAAAFSHPAGGGGYASYRTGDWAARRGGHLHFVSRVDRQVKIHGFRLELGEVDAAIRACGVTTACTVLDGDKLHSFLEGGDGIDVAALRRNLAQRLPAHAVPEQVHVLAHLPRNANDKIDSRALVDLLRADKAAE